MNVHESTLKGLQEALDYVKGDKTKARAVIVEIPDDEIKFNRIYRKLSDENKIKIMNYANELSQA
jgi:hypothetical protein